MLAKILKPKSILIVILLLTAFFRFYRLDFPNQMVFDEVYHAYTAKEYLAWHKEAWEWWTTPPPGVAYEWTHPPLAKEIMAVSMLVLHSTDPWAWRVPGALMGILSVFLIYLVTKKLFKSEAASLIAAFAFSLDGLNFVQSRTGMNDVYFIAFMLATVLFMLDKKYLISAVFLGLALASKWTGLYLIGFVMMILLLINIKDRVVWITLIILGLFGGSLVLTAKMTKILEALHLPQQSAAFDSWMNDFLIPFLLNPWFHLTLAIILAVYLFLMPKFRKIGYFLLIPAVVYLLTYIPLFLMGHEYKIFTGLQQQMWWYHTNLKATHDYASSWWSWPLNLYPVWYYVQYYDNGTLSNIFGSGNPILYVGGIIAIVASVWKFSGEKIRAFLAVLFIALPLTFVAFVFTHIQPNSEQTILSQIFQPEAAINILILIGIVFTIISMWNIYKANTFSPNKDRQRNLFIAVFGYLIFWLPWAFSPRIMFLYHYCPTIPFLSIVLGYQLNELLISSNHGVALSTTGKSKVKYLHWNFKHLLNQNRIIVSSFLLLMFLGFIFLYPVLTGIPLEKSQLVYFFRTNLTKDPFGLGK